MTSVLGGRRRSAAFVRQRFVHVPESLTGLLGEGNKVIAAARDSARPIDTQRPLGGVSKRCIDLVLGVAILIVLSPIILAVAVLIRVRLGGPVFFSQQRIGFRGKLFNCYRFRGTRADAAKLSDTDPAEEWQSRTLSNDPSACCLDNVLQKSGLDELPQLFNVIRGDMSLVGPRPVLPEELANYGRYARDYCRARPGITGIWQAGNGSEMSYRGHVARDYFYVSNWSLRLDMALLLNAVKAVTKLN